ncbi:MAG: hypothetical protein KAS93_01340 [Gammaproteobacteria bacterium]|nr:hypothetical protein [Gammaproteobacteria bacterium]
MRDIFQYIKLADVTLREGRQAQGFAMTPASCMSFMRLIDDFGVDIVELNHPASSSELHSFIQDAIALPGVQAKLATHVRCVRRDLELAFETGCKNIHCYISASRGGLREARETFKRSVDDIKAVSDECLRTQANLRISFEHTFALDLDFLGDAYLQLADMLAVSRLGFADTTGSCFPDKVLDYVHNIACIVPANIPFHFHFHNDHGLAAANFLALYSIADQLQRELVFDVSVGGLGERNGILSFGDVLSIMYLRNKKELERRFNLQSYKELFDFVRQYVNGNNFVRRDPINPAAFTHSAGPHLKGMLRDGSYESIDPNSFGMRAIYNVINSGTGWRGVKAWIKESFNCDIKEESAKCVAAEIRSLTAQHGSLHEHELEHVIKQYLE